MDMKKRVEKMRDVLNSAIEMDMDKETLLKISREVDKCIVAYYQKNKIDNNKKN